MALRAVGFPSLGQRAVPKGWSQHREKRARGGQRGADTCPFATPVVSSEVGLLQGAPVCPGISPWGYVLVPGPFRAAFGLFSEGFSTLMYCGSGTVFLSWGWR